MFGPSRRPDSKTFVQVRPLLECVSVRLECACVFMRVGSRWITDHGCVCKLFIKPEFCESGAFWI